MPEVRGNMAARFTCPVCGSHFFRTGLPNIPGVDLSSPMVLLIGECKGRALVDEMGKPLRGRYAGCSFRWSRADDARYGLLPL